MKVEIHLKDQSHPISREVVNAYVKGPFYCVYLHTGKVEKYPLQIIWRVTEDYS